MSLRTKLYYGEQILRELSSSPLNRDMPISIREAIIRVDAVVNAFAKEGILKNWQKYGGIDDQYIQTIEWVNANDPANGEPSTLQIPSHYVELPRNQGIEQVYFQNSFSAVKKKYFQTVIIRDWKSVSTYRNNRAGRMEGRISCAPKNGYLVFDRGNINATYGPIGLRIVGRDSSAIGDTDPYPITADMEQIVITTCVQWFRERLSQQPDLIRDDVNKT